jgi:hypothetical protein
VIPIKTTVGSESLFKVKRQGYNILHTQAKHQFIMSAGAEAGSEAGGATSPLLGPLGTSPQGSMADSTHEQDEMDLDEGDAWGGIPPGWAEQPAGEERQAGPTRSVSPERPIRTPAEEDRVLCGNTMVRLMQNQETVMKVLAKQKSRRHKVHVHIPDKFDGKVGDYIDSLLEQFEMLEMLRENMTAV